MSSVFSLFSSRRVGGDSKEVAFDPQEIEKIRKLCPRFRILIIGRANSGKTTILKKICDTSEGPIVHDTEGNELPASILNGPDAMRGIHDINLEITYESNLLFVFHDSMGFEAGSAEELIKVVDFIKQRLAKTELRDRLHAIWYCIPTDSDRVASKAELSFFQESTGDIPVILLFTKWDGQIVKACNTLRYRERMDKKQALQAAPQRAQRILEEEYIPIFKNTPYPPASYTVLGYMDKPETKCSELCEKTAAALDNAVLKKLFISVQTHNIQICIRNAINDVISTVISPQRPFKSIKQEEVIGIVLSWFPHLFWDSSDYSAEEKDKLLVVGFRTLVKCLQTGTKKTYSSHQLQLLYTVASSAIVATRSFDMKQSYGSSEAALKVSIAEYLASSQRKGVKAAIKSQFHQYAKSYAISQEAYKALPEELSKICLDNILVTTGLDGGPGAPV